MNMGIKPMSTFVPTQPTFVKQPNLGSKTLKTSSDQLTLAVTHKNCEEPTLVKLDRGMQTKEVSKRKSDENYYKEESQDLREYTKQLDGFTKYYRTFLSD